MLWDLGPGCPERWAMPPCNHSRSGWVGLQAACCSCRHPADLKGDCTRWLWPPNLKHSVIQYLKTVAFLILLLLFFQLLWEALCSCLSCTKQETQLLQDDDDDQEQYWWKSIYCCKTWVEMNQILFLEEMLQKVFYSRTCISVDIYLPHTLVKFEVVSSRITKVFIICREWKKQGRSKTCWLKH